MSIAQVQGGPWLEPSIALSQDQSCAVLLPSLSTAGTVVPFLIYTPQFTTLPTLHKGLYCKQTSKSTCQIAHQELGAIHCVQGYAALLPNLTLGTISRKSSLSSSPSSLTISDSSPTSFRHQTEKSLFLGNASKIPNMAPFAANKLSLKAIGRGFTWQPPLPCHIM